MAFGREVGMFRSLFLICTFCPILGFSVLVILQNSEYIVLGSNGTSVFFFFFFMLWPWDLSWSLRCGCD